jgi:hypothetical protein
MRPRSQKCFLGQVISQGPVTTGPSQKGSQGLLMALDEDGEGIIGPALYGCDQGVVI